MRNPTTGHARRREAVTQELDEDAGSTSLTRPTARGRFLCLGDTKLSVRGVTYGTFRPRTAWGAYPPPDVLDRDFAAIAASGFNAVRTYTLPPRALLDTAWRHGLAVLVGLWWEQNTAFLDDRRRARRIVDEVHAAIRACAGHPAVLAYALGNEIPAPIVRWHGARAVERFLGTLADTARDADPGALVTYVNYPSTEYLELDFLDLACFNVYLESRDRLDAYLARLHNLAGERPLILAEVGLDSRSHGTDTQARVLDWQVRTVFASGCAGAFVFAWTDEWHCGGLDINDWDFGLTDRERRAKPALVAVSRAMEEVPVPKAVPRPRVSVVVCSFNGARTIRDCLDGLLALDYPDYEVIVVDDGSTDATAAIAAQYPFRLIRTANRGLSNARNTGLAAATGEIVAYVDDDAWPDPHWLSYLATTFEAGQYGGGGGPNLPPPGDGWIAEAVAHAPGGPTHVLLTDREAEHVPGCNMAFRKSALEAIGGFDPRFRTAGDDVDVCWRLQDAGWTLGFSPAAVVWHHRRNSVRAYWRQQIGYGRAEAMLERKWPARYNAAGHTAWNGRLYGPPAGRARARGERVYHGVWGSAPFQSLYAPAPGGLAALVTMPEWVLVIAALGLVGLLGLAWRPLALALPLCGLAALASVLHAASCAARARLGRTPATPLRRLRLRALIAALHLLQPLARLRGRIGLGLTPWRWRGPVVLGPFWARRFAIWTEVWQAPADRLRAIEAAVAAGGLVVRRGGDWDRWDLETRSGAFGGARLRMAVEEHGQGRQLARFHIWPRVPWWVGAAIVTSGALAGAAAADAATTVAAVMGTLSIAVAIRAAVDCASARAGFLRARHVLEKRGGQHAAGAAVSAATATGSTPRDPAEAA